MSHPDEYRTLTPQHRLDLIVQRLHQHERAHYMAGLAMDEMDLLGVPEEALERADARRDMQASQALAEYYYARLDLPARVEPLEDAATGEHGSTETEEAPA